MQDGHAENAASSSTRQTAPPQTLIMDTVTLFLTPFTHRIREWRVNSHIWAILSRDWGPEIGPL